MWLDLIIWFGMGAAMLAVVEAAATRSRPRPYCPVCGLRSQHWAGCPHTPKKKETTRGYDER